MEEVEGQVAGRMALSRRLTKPGGSMSEVVIFRQLRSWIPVFEPRDYREYHRYTKYTTLNTTAGIFRVRQCYWPEPLARSLCLATDFQSVMMTGLPSRTIVS